MAWAKARFRVRDMVHSRARFMVTVGAGLMLGLVLVLGLGKV